MEENRFKEEERDWFQIFSILIASLPAFLCGFLLSWPSPAIPHITEGQENYNVSLEEASYFTVIPPIGAIISSIPFSKLNDIIGRKCTLLCIAFPYITSLVIISSTKSVYLLYVARFVSGLGDGCVYTSLSMYIGEIATPKVRGTWGNFMSFSIYFGQFMVNVIGSYTSVAECACIALAIPVVFLLVFSFMPESPYFHLMKERVEDARMSLQKLRRIENVEDELERLKKDVRRQMSESGTWRDLVTIESNRRALFAGIFLRTSQQLGGITAFAVYTQLIFAKAGGLSANYSAMVFMGLCAGLNFCAGLVLDKLGRKKAYFCSILLCSFVLAAESLYFYLNLKLDWIPLFGMILYMIFYSFGVGIVPTLMLGELFSTSIKTKGLTTLAIVYGILISFTTKIFHLLDTSFGLFAPFLFFSVCSLLSSFLTLFLVPETKDKTLEEIQQSLKRTKDGNEQTSSI